MTTEVTVPEFGESIHDVRLIRWFKKEGDQVRQDEDLAEIESEKATIVLPAPQAGRLAQILVSGGEDAKVGQVIGRIEAVSAGAGAAKSPVSPASPGSDGVPSPSQVQEKSPAKETNVARADRVSPAAGPDARRALREHRLSAEEVAAEAARERLTRDDVEQYAKEHAAPAPQAQPPKATLPATKAALVEAERVEELVPMSPLRRRIAARLVQAQQEGALLTTVNEIDMSAVVGLRKKYGEPFQKQHDVRLGFMSFFVSAAVDALRHFPAINSEVRGNDIVYKKYYDIGIAVGTERGLVVPVVRGADRLSLSELERQIAELARRARDNRLVPADLTGGTFTITNGGIYGSLLSTPIVNPPQSAILGLHAIQDRPAAVDGQVVVRPLMYVALTYDHRVVDGGEAVSFLRRIKEQIEDPLRMFIDV
ncbi:MAG: 2-oxoglutarate dehydrogenase complex dihydrolipoyllysine-residue succinyltransferase [Planctomycetes bacterium]|nr:2-oxoglutarate dehydrogenase complex dihydrolipoyllysine-residue succinyltransferase [Planctomycetota bacterium]